MRNPEHLARLYDALHRGDEEEESERRAERRAAVITSYQPAPGAGRQQRQHPRAAAFAEAGAWKHIPKEQ